ncbi:Hypothetical protein R9X50_00030600 [Acrodontium crateriforme]|uniref:Cytochrome c oxidase assembly factor 3 n=1 Tax=Acrodontium crateriforme TaxID=150365 RepID=A0AAQ3LYK5_9PEZI|nr:Hypothetical protein R9X50_00030600 [Acrodontium crateriforme]
MVLGRRVPQSSYYDKNNRPSAALYRARQPYLVRNAVTGFAIIGFVAAVYSWTIRAIGQDDFSDVPMPDAPAPHTTTIKSTGNSQ